MRLAADADEDDGALVEMEVEEGEAEADEEDPALWSPVVAAPALLVVSALLLASPAMWLLRSSALSLSMSSVTDRDEWSRE